MPDTWKNYFELTKNRSPRPWLVRALLFVKKREHALDLGSGALNEATYLLDQGFLHVTSVDKESIAEEIALNFPKEKFQYVISLMEDFEYPKATYDLVNAQYALPYIPPEKFIETMKKIEVSLKPGGILVGQLFGDKDGWKNRSAMTFHTKKQATNALQGFEVLEFQEEKKDGKTAAGTPKPWHVFHFIARKKS